MKTLTILLALAAWSCNETYDHPISPAKPDELPPYTETGANTFGMKVDGKVWLPKTAVIPGGDGIIILQVAAI